MLSARELNLRSMVFMIGTLKQHQSREIHVKLRLSSIFPLNTNDDSLQMGRIIQIHTDGQIYVLSSQSMLLFLGHARLVGSFLGAAASTTDSLAPMEEPNFYD